ncbi:restriction endonuclease subunit S [Leptolyngbya sp. BC1307]|uniref:restriction endonuclease subunit S n=1 Tax=Leptolyngbya sp. BC1307 TaxID=2029589 RepID=UPI000EFA4767|nr:restriction endonuclease subunit S [Leptolyngbya sp. BC1307]
MIIAKNSSWNEIPLKFLFSERALGAWGEEADDDEGIVCIRAADFVTHELRHKVNNLTRRKYSEQEINSRQLKKGDLILERSGGGEKQPVGRVISFDLNEPALCSNFLEALRPRQASLYSRFGTYLFYSLWASRAVIPYIKQTTGIQNLDAKEYLSQFVSVPGIAQQRKIADYLDRETAKLDALIAAKQRLLTLLAEKRRAMITQAVTRGVRGDVPMKDSGIEWLGEIPRDWEIVSLNFLAEVKTGITKGRNLGNRETIKVPYLRVANVQDGYLDLKRVTSIEVLPEEVESFSLQKEDVLMNEGGDADKLGRGAVWDSSIEPCLHQNHVFAVRCHSVSPYWLTTFTSSNFAKAYFESRAKQSTNLASISGTNLKELPVILPSNETQMEILQYLQSSLTRLDSLLSITESAIGLLQERRTSLISAAVTGQLQIAA